MIVATTTPPRVLMNTILLVHELKLPKSLFKTYCGLFATLSNPRNHYPSSFQQSKHPSAHFIYTIVCYLFTLLVQLNRYSLDIES